MMVAELTDRFARVEAQIAREKGDFVLFALFMREEVPDRWDLIVAVPWAWNDNQAAVRYIVDQIKSVLGSQELTNLSRIVCVDPDHAAVQALNRLVRVEHGNVELRDSNLLGLPVKHACIITSKRPSEAASA